MKARLAELLITYRHMRDRTRSKLVRRIFDEVIYDLESLLKDAQ